MIKEMARLIWDLWEGIPNWQMARHERLHWLLSRPGSSKGEVQAVFLEAVTESSLAGKQKERLLDLVEADWESARNMALMASSGHVCKPKRR